ncbi:MAG: hypothetical protein HS111_09965 [Kofleriaceae bacterium]|nr:hypothetical protein [Kofleriaceae bacterium]
MPKNEGVHLSQREAERWLAGVVLVGFVIDLDEGYESLRRLPATMAELWDVAYRRVDEAARRERELRLVSAAPPGDRMLVHACYGLATMCQETDLRAAVDDMAERKQDSKFAAAINRSIAVVKAKLDEILVARRAGTS